MSRAENAHAMFARSCGKKARSRIEDAEIASRSGPWAHCRIEYDQAVFDKCCVSHCCAMGGREEAASACRKGRWENSSTASAHDVFDCSWGLKEVMSRIADAARECRRGPAAPKRSADKDHAVLPSSCSGNSVRIFIAEAAIACKRGWSRQSRKANAHEDCERLGATTSVMLASD